ncbi:MAG: ATP-dependent sacrificial sulfur transferase LarE [Coriobacteriia bacterium]
MSSAEKYDALLDVLAGLDSVLVAYSGGIDSTLLAFAAHAVLGDRCCAVLATSDTYPESEAAAARLLASQLGFRLIEVETCELADPNFTANTSDRCYLCKSELFGLLIRVADVQGLAKVADGSNHDDLSDHRPGRRAAAEFGVVSPLAQVGLSKAEIRELAQELGLPNWNKPSMACLASRFPYGQRITDSGLARVSTAEQALRDLGISQFRVRAHGPIARVEIAPEELQDAWALREQIASEVRRAGFTYAALDLEGYRTGSMNEVLGLELAETDLA